MTAAERAAAERRSQDLPATITDPATVARVAELVRSAETSHARDAA